MPRLDLPALAKAQGIRRRAITLRPIIPTTAAATELAQIILPAANIWAQAKADILAGYVLPTRDGLTVDGASDIQAAIDRTANEMQRLVLLVTPRLRQWAVKLERKHRDRWIANVKAGVGVDLSTVLTAGEVEETVETFIARNVALVKDVSAQAQSRISDAVFRGYQNRTPLREVAKQIDEAVSLGRKRALRISSHQNANFSAALDTERKIEAGIDKMKWMSSGKLHYRPHHKARDGKIYEVTTGKAVDGSEVIPSSDRAGTPPGCGCRELAYLDIMSEL